MTFDELFDELFDVYGYILEQEPCCENPYESLEDGYLVCRNCGTVGQSVYLSDPNELSTHYRSFYKRLNYFRELLYLFSNIKTSSSEYYPALINQLKNHQTIIAIKDDFFGESDEYKRNMLLKVDIVSTLRRILLEMNKSKFYKHIYNIILDLFDFKTFDIPRMQIIDLCGQFYNVEILFKRLYPTKSNMLSYKVILKQLFIRNDIKNYDFILKPNNHNDVLCLLSPVLPQ
jgi:hypothetical protein